MRGSISRLRESPLQQGAVSGFSDSCSHSICPRRYCDLVYAGRSAAQAIRAILLAKATTATSSTPRSRGDRRPALRWYVITLRRRE